jgi:hypothetical protein
MIIGLYIAFFHPYTPLVGAENKTPLFEPWITKNYAYEIEKKQYDDLAFCLTVAFTESLNTLKNLDHLSSQTLTALGYRSTLDKHTPLIFAITKHLVRFADTTINNQTFPFHSEGDFAQRVCKFFGKDKKRITLMIQEVEKRRKNALELCSARQHEAGNN